jgi:hypothetical protein
MVQIKLKTATHILAQPGMVTVSETEAARLCALGVTEPVKEAEPKPAKEEPKKAKKAAK